jgi:hypothetical protein
MIKKLIRFIISLAIITNVSASIFADQKRDVRDPVLREIINELGGKMPKFTNKYGDSVFVADEPLTRGSFISALYEYDKKIRGKASESPADPNGQLISKREFDLLKNKVSSLEKTGVSAGKGGIAKNIDIVAIISDLEPNMPMLLDNSLKSSKVFKELQQQILSGSGGKDSSSFSSSLSPKELSEMKRVLGQIQSSYIALSKKVEDLKTKTEYYGSASSSKGALSGTDVNYFNKQLKDIKKTVAEIPSIDDLYKEINKSQNQTQADIERIEKKLKKIKDAPGDSSSSSDSGLGTKIATLSLGFTMLAALFVSR